MPLKKPKQKINFSEQLKRLDSNPELRKSILKFCRLKKGDVWIDPVKGHKIGVLDAVKKDDIQNLFEDRKTTLVINDPPYNVIVGNLNSKALSKIKTKNYINFSQKWISNALEVMGENSSLYVWMGADQNDGFQPFAEFIISMREYTELKSRSLITMRNQRGYGTQKNWMAVRQELLYYIKGNPNFNVLYTDIPKLLRGYYKNVNGKRTENIERSRSNNIRPGNVWVDIQQVFYRMEENVPGAYAQKPLKSIERIILSSSEKNDVVLDMFAHSGTTLIASEKTDRTCYCFDIDPIFAEMTIRRLEHYRKTGKSGWQWNSPFPELDKK